jgi:hypothetical protein
MLIIVMGEAVKTTVAESDALVTRIRPAGDCVSPMDLLGYLSLTDYLEEIGSGSIDLYRSGSDVAALYSLLATH